MISAQSVLDRHWDGRLPVDVEAIARAEGLELEPHFGLDVSGEIASRDDGRIVVRYNATEALVRRRFTIAHEIGHFALGHLSQSAKLFRDTPAEFSSSSGSQVERQANAFAAALLMPANIVRYMITQRGVTKLDELCRQFDVSQAAMKYRLNNLGIVRV